MGEISGGYNAYSLERGPASQFNEIAVPGSCPGIFGVNVKVSEVYQYTLLMNVLGNYCP